MAKALPELRCPSCKAAMAMARQDVGPSKASSFETCIRRCSKCGIGASNAESGIPTFIHRDPLTNIPREARAGALETLRAALNIQNRQKKESYFGFSTSEDAVTWVVFGYLQRFGLLGSALQQLGIAIPGLGHSEPAMLLWGVPLGTNPRATQLRARLVAECGAWGERPNALSEPDVVIDFGDQGILLIEVKYLSGNDNQPNTYAHWSKYESHDRLTWRFDDVKTTGCYELARYWCLLNRLTDGRRGCLVNLGLPALFSGPEGARLDRFIGALDTNESLQFKKATWAELLSFVLPSAEGWFSRFCREERSLGIR